MTTSFLFRADASAIIGTGHVMRCLALAQCLRSKGNPVTFLAAEMGDSMRARLESEGIPVKISGQLAGSPEDESATVNEAKLIGANWVILDGYRFGGSFQRKITESGLKLLAFDDFGHADHYSAQLVLNQNIYASEAFYPSRSADTRLLLGTRFSLLRDEFHTKSSSRSVQEKISNILVTLGGADEPNCSLKILQALERFGKQPLDINLIAGPQNLHLEELKSWARNSRHRISVISSTNDMPSFMQSADLAFTAGGSTCWELCFMGVPFLSAIIAENQVRTVEGIVQAGVTINLGWFNSFTADTVLAALTELEPRESRERRKALGLAVVDGRGRERVAEAMLQESARGGSS